MLIDRLRSSKKDNDVNLKKKFVRYLVVGDNYFAGKSYLELRDRFLEDDVAFVTERALRTEDFKIRGLSPFRGESNLKAFSYFYSSLDDEEDDFQADSLFYKEGEWRSFQGRSKPQTQFFAESFFNNPREVVSVAWDLEEKGVEQILHEAQFHLIASIRLGSSDDLLNEQTWEIETTDGVLYQCEYLIWGQSEKRFLEVFSAKNELSNQLIELYDDVGKIKTLLVRYVFDRPIKGDFNTYFIPLSYTHEWGHFVGEYDGFEGEMITSMNFIHFVDELDTSEEEVAKRIAILERSLEKVFPEVPLKTSRRTIFLDSQSPRLHFNIRPTENDSTILRKIFFVTLNSPLPASEIVDEVLVSNCSYVARGFLSLHYMLKKIMPEK